MGRPEVGCNYHAPLPATVLEVSFRLSCLISTCALRPRFIVIHVLGKGGPKCLNIMPKGPSASSCRAGIGMGILSDSWCVMGYRKDELVSKPQTEA